MQEGSSVTVCGDLSSVAETTVTVTLAVTDGTAEQNVDFTLSDLLLIFQPGVPQSCMDVSALVDNTLEGDETFTLELQSTNGLVQISQTAGMTTITIPNQDSTLVIDLHSQAFTILAS